VTCEYRRMTPDERAAVVEERRRRGHPWHAPPHPFREAGWYFLTAVNFEHAPIIAPDSRRTAFESDLLSAMEAKVGGWVVPPNHYHILVGVQSLDDVSASLKLLHGRSSRLWNLEDGTTGQRKVWYRFQDRCVRNERHYFRALNYMHFNPVKHGYVDSPYDWPWSSVHGYPEARGRQWLREQWLAHPIDEFGQDWGVWDEG
jgi:putative transposase